MAQRELLILGSSAQTPTRRRHPNGYLLRWDAEQILFDPGEGTQRQLILAGTSVARIGRICVTHFHGDHCLGLPGIIQRFSMDHVAGPVHVHYPAEGDVYFQRLRGAASFHETTQLVPDPCGPGTVAQTPAFTLEARALVHRVPTLGWRLSEPAQRHFLPERLAGAGLQGPDVGRLDREGSVTVNGRAVAADDVSEVRPGQHFAFVMDTALCDAAFALAQDADLLVCEATYLEADAKLARRYGHLTAAQAARIAAESGARRLVLTHFSQRYASVERFAQEAGEVFGDVVVAEDLMRVDVPARRAP